MMATDMTKFIFYQEESYIENLKKLLNMPGEVTVDALLSRAAYKLAHAICSRMLLRAKLSAFKIYKLNQFAGTSRKSIVNLYQ
jgi:hypothetical protein